MASFFILFQRTKVSNFSRIQWISVFIYRFCFYFCHILLLLFFFPNLRSQWFSPMFSSGSFIVLHFIFQYDLFWINFCVRDEVLLLCFALVEGPMVPKALVEETVLFYQHAFASLPEFGYPYTSNSGLYILDHWSSCVVTPTPPCVNHRSFVIYPEIMRHSDHLWGRSTTSWREQNKRIWQHILNYYKDLSFFPQ